MSNQPWRHLGPNAWAMVQYLHDKRNDPMVWVSRSRIEDAVYDYQKPGPTAVKNLVLYSNPILRRHGWEVRSRKGYYGGYRLCKVGEDIPKQSIPDGTLEDLEQITGTI